jgi:nucleoside-diphosphate-sugar epimerase
MSPESVVSAVMARLHTVVGSGPLGRSVVRALDRRRPDDDVRLVNRSGSAADLPPSVDVVGADVSNAGEAARAFDGASVVYLCAQPPYGEWPDAFPPLVEGALAGAERADARFVFGDNLYMYGPTEGPLTEDLPYDATGPKGRTRAALAEAVLDAHEAGRVETTIGRGSDFYGPHVRESTVGERVFEAALDGDRASALGDPSLPHTYTYIDDFGEALVTLGTDEAALGRAWHVPNPETLTTREFVDLVYEAAGTAPARIRSLDGVLFTVASLVSSQLRELRETRYQFERPWVVDHGDFAETFGANPAPTPHEEAIRATLEWFESERS